MSRHCPIELFREFWGTQYICGSSEKIKNITLACQLICSIIISLNITYFSFNITFRSVPNYTLSMGYFCTAQSYFQLSKIHLR
jgi:hypothetical protein